MFVIMREKEGKVDFLKDFKAGVELFGEMHEAKKYQTKRIAETVKDVLRQHDSTLTIEEIF